MSAIARRSISVQVNDKTVVAEVEPRTLLSDFIRRNAQLTGTHVGCEHGVCGACTIQLDGAPVRSCLMLAVQADGRHVRTVEGLSSGDELHPLQEAFREAHGLQCGFCTPGILMTMEALLSEGRLGSDEEIRDALNGNVCRCTGYQNIIAAIKLAATKMSGDSPDADAAPAA